MCKTYFCCQSLCNSQTVPHWVIYVSFFTFFLYSDICCAWISINIKIKFVPNGLINNKTSLVQMTASCRVGSIIWTIDGFVYWHINASPGVNELNGYMITVQDEASIYALNTLNVNWRNATYHESHIFIWGDFMHPQTWRTIYRRTNMPDIVQIFTINWNKYFNVFQHRLKTNT